MGFLAPIVLRTIMIFRRYGLSLSSNGCRCMCSVAFPAVYRRKMALAKVNRHWRKTDGALAARASAHD
ncbi:hypothetical protein KCP75_17045 [Salmonella enterica subsp. enterica]|nr:hypothetical protein KCP75_17045 [Salmonella enterica subsp. enterica]